MFSIKEMLVFYSKITLNVGHGFIQPTMPSFMIPMHAKCIHLQKHFQQEGQMKLGITLELQCHWKILFHLTKVMNVQFNAGLLITKIGSIVKKLAQSSSLLTQKA